MLCIHLQAVVSFFTGVCVLVQDGYCGRSDFTDSRGNKRRKLFGLIPMKERDSASVMFRKKLNESLMEDAGAKKQVSATAVPSNPLA